MHNDNPKLLLLPLFVDTMTKARIEANLYTANITNCQFAIKTTTPNGLHAAINFNEGVSKIQSAMTKL